MAETPRRKLTTVMSADVAGYSRLMDRDEVGTLERLIAYREAMAGLIARHRGRVVNTAGDSLLAEFDSVVESVQCAAEIQRELGARNAELDGSQQMRFRIGINLGDVIVQGDDLYGEGVNIAARLQGLAEPGGICISGTAYDQVHNKLTLGYEFIGAQPVKNIEEEVPVYRVLLDAAAARIGLGVRPSPPPPPCGPAGPGQRQAASVAPARRVYMLFILSLFLAVGALVAGGLGEERGPRGSFAKIEGDASFTEDTAFMGKIGGNVVVAPGVTVRLGGKIEGDLILGPRAVAEVGGRIEGDVINHGGVLRLRGELDGSERHEEPEDYDGPAATQLEAPAGAEGAEPPPLPPLSEGEAPRGVPLWLSIEAMLATLFALVLVAAAVLAYVHRGDGTSWLDSHYRFQIRTFWICALLAAIGAATAPIVVGIVVLVLLPFWLLIRSVRGWRALVQGAPHPKPETWLLG